MPGIAGFITNKRREQAVPQLGQMLQTLRRGRSEVIGTFTEESLGLYIGWVTRKGSSPDRTPLGNEHGDAVLVFSGEEFPDPGTERRLRQRGHEFDGGGLSYLVHLYEEDP